MVDEDDRKLVEGGQGRTGDEVVRDAEFTLWLLLAAMAIVAATFLLLGCASLDGLKGII